MIQEYSSLDGAPERTTYSGDAVSTSSGQSAPAAAPAGASAAAVALAPAAIPGGATGDLTIVTVANTPKQCPHRKLQPDEIVEVSAIPTNTQPVAVGLNGSNAARYGPRVLYAPAGAGTPRDYNLGVLSQLWVMAQVTGEGVSITIRKKITSGAGY